MNLQSMLQTQRASAVKASKAGLLAATMALGLATVQPAQALTIVLDFVPSATTDIFGVGSVSESFASWGFTGLAAGQFFA